MAPQSTRNKIRKPYHKLQGPKRYGPQLTASSSLLTLFLSLCSKITALFIPEIKIGENEQQLHLLGTYTATVCVLHWILTKILCIRYSPYILKRKTQNSRETQITDNVIISYNSNLSLLTTVPKKRTILIINAI